MHQEVYAHGNPVEFSLIAAYKVCNYFANELSFLEIAMNLEILKKMHTVLARYYPQYWSYDGIMHAD